MNFDMTAFFHKPVKLPEIIDTNNCGWMKVTLSHKITNHFHDGPKRVHGRVEQVSIPKRETLSTILRKLYAITILLHTQSCTIDTRNAPLAKSGAMISSLYSLTRQERSLKGIFSRGQNCSYR